MLLHFTLKYIKLIIFITSFVKARSHKFSLFSSSSVKYMDFAAYHDKTSKVECLALCDGQDMCASVNYNLDTERCELTPYARIVQTPAMAAETNWRVYHKECPSDWEFFGGSCYLFSNVFRGWEDSEAFCESQNASLVVIEDSNEDDYIRSVISVQYFENFYWIGGRYDQKFSEYRWNDETAITFDGWGPGKPDYNKGCMNYLNNGNVKWQWNDHYDCINTKGPSICESHSSD